LYLIGETCIVILSCPEIIVFLKIKVENSVNNIFNQLDM
jgi:hypothetical protein